MSRHKIIFTPPAERFYGEIRKITANRVFKNIEEQEKLIDEALTNYMKNKESIKQLCGYEWIIEGWNKCLNM